MKSSNPLPQRNNNMERLQKAAILSSLTQQLLKNGSWCGETHIQKSMYLLQELCDVPTGFEFILYKHGPFSFDLRDELMSMRADGLLTMVEQYPYGPKLVPTQAAVRVQGRFPKTMNKYASSTAFVAASVGAKTVADLEKLATALFVEREYGMGAGDTEGWACRIHALKPHVSVNAARATVQELLKIEREAPGD
jgi:hypothetical protein